jgi:amino-acid N-acetyltransferase
MSTAAILIERAGPADVRAVEALLASASLPLDGAAEAVAHAGVVAREGSAVVGAAALEIYGEAGLLRSVVVAREHRGTGLGRAVVAAAEALARDEGVRDLYLITETAIDWFPRLGYTPVERAVANDAVGASIEFTTVCRDKGVPMVRQLG